MNISGYSYVQGVQQDARGRDYMVGYNDRGERNILYVEPQPVSAKTTEGLKPVMQPSQLPGRPPYKTLMCYQNRGR